MGSAASTVGVAAAVSVATAAGLVYAALSATSQIFGPVVVAGDDPAEIALTFDDGPNPAATPYLLDVLAQHNVRATFFLIGRFVREAPRLAREIAAAGHLIGNHTMTHPWLPLISAARVRQELAGCNAAIEDTLGMPVWLFRPPHGARTPNVLLAACELGLTSVNWNIITGDWNPIEADVIQGRVVRGMERNRRRRRGSNVVMHDGGQAGLGQPRMATVRAVEKLLTESGDSPRRFVTPEVWI